MAQKRSIFEEVQGDATPAARAVTKGGIDRPKGARRAVGLWLWVLAALVVAMVLVGGLTRLTDSGLSITEWKPVTGALPPLSDAAWDEEFTKYQAIPEYIEQNKGMTLAEFKSIYWWEWAHRFLGRFVGLVWAVGFLAFLALRKIPPGWTGRLLLVGALGGLQGFVGWWMVSSGLVGSGRLDVASYRLATHLGLAFIILGFIAWYAQHMARPEAALMQARRSREAKLFSLSTGLLHLTFLQILLGALVAGIDAGRGFTDWPLMAGRFFPPDAFDLVPLWRNFFEDAGLVQFTHRIAGYLVFIMGLVVWSRGRASAHAATRRAFNLVGAMVALQVVLGIVTVMHSSPLHIAIFHQAGAIALWLIILRARFLSQYPVQQSIRGN